MRSLLAYPRHSLVPARTDSCPMRRTGLRSSGTSRSRERLGRVYLASGAVSKSPNPPEPTYHSTYNTSTGKGTFYHSGSLVWVDAGQAPHKGLKWQGFRIRATDKSHYYLVATVGNQAPYVPSITVAESTAAPKITHSGKKYQIDGIKFRLTPTAQSQLTAALGETISTSLVVFDSDLYFTMK